MMYAKKEKDKMPALSKMTFTLKNKHSNHRSQITFQLWLCDLTYTVSKRLRVAFFIKPTVYPIPIITSIYNKFDL